MERDTQSVPGAGFTVFAPLLLLSLAFVAWLAFQVVLQWGDRQQLLQAQANLESSEQGAAKVRSALDAVATATAKLAAEGNANARTIVEQLRQHGVTINTPGAVKPP